MLPPVKYVKRLLTDFIYALYPRNCLNCTNILLQNEDYLCTTCLLNLPRTAYHEDLDNPLYQHFAHTQTVVEAFAFLHFQPSGVAQHLLHALKYQSKPGIGHHFGRMYGKELRNDREWELDLILPIPMHWKKQRRRGYNQSELLADGLSEALELPVLKDAVAKAVDTTSQTRKGRLERWDNVREVFHLLKPTALRDQHILLVDDVITTGATTSALCDQLIKCDVASITVCALATGVR